jgi:hypothetical protein
MNIVPVSYNGVLINDGATYSAYFPQTQSIALAGSAEAVAVERAFLPPDYAAKKVNAKIVPITIIMRGVIATQLDALKKLFSPRDQTPHLLVVKDVSDSDRQWQVYATAIAHPDISGASTTFSLYIEDDWWYTVTQNTDTWSITLPTSTHNITTIGNANAQPVFEITPTSLAPGSYLYNRFIAIFNNTSVNFTNYPLNVLGTGFDTAALVTAGKMLASGNDLRMVLDGTEATRWLGAMNTTATRAWMNISLAPKLELTMTTTSIGLLPTTISVSGDLSRLPSGALVMMGTEIMICGTPDVPTMTLPIVARGQKGTTAVGHTAGETAKWIQHDLYMKYGLSTASAPTLDNTYMPIFNTATSTNTSWVYANFFSLSNRNMMGQWTPSVISSLKSSTTYTGLQNTVADYSTAMGMAYVEPKVSGRWKSDNATLIWSITNPSGIDSVSMTGQKWMSKYWLATASMQYTTDNVNYVTAWTETAPALSTWTAFTHAGVATSGSPKTVRAIFAGSATAYQYLQAYYEIDTATLALSSSTSPTVTVGAEVGATFYPINAKIMNVTTGDYVTIAYPMYLNQTLMIDTVNRTVTINGQSVLSSMAMSSVRVQWLDLLPSATNQLSYTQTAGVGGVTFVTKWQDRNP